MFEDEELIDHRKQKDELREILDKHIAEYLARGGKIKQMEFGQITEGVDMRDVTFATRMNLEMNQLRKEKERNREKLIQKISAGKPIDLFGEE